MAKKKKKKNEKKEISVAYKEKSAISELTLTPFVEIRSDGYAYLRVEEDDGMPWDICRLTPHGTLQLASNIPDGIGLDVTNTDEQIVVEKETY